MPFQSRFVLSFLLIGSLAGVLAVGDETPLNIDLWRRAIHFEMARENASEILQAMLAIQKRATRKAEVASVERFWEKRVECTVDKAGLGWFLGFRPFIDQIGEQFSSFAGLNPNWSDADKVRLVAFGKDRHLPDNLKELTGDYDLRYIQWLIPEMDSFWTEVVFKSDDPLVKEIALHFQGRRDEQYFNQLFSTALYALRKANAKGSNEVDFTWKDLKFAGPLDPEQMTVTDISKEVLTRTQSMTTLLTALRKISDRARLSPQLTEALRILDKVSQEPPNDTFRGFMGYHLGVSQINKDFARHGSRVLAEELVGRIADTFTSDKGLADVYFRLQQRMEAQGFKNDSMPHGAMEIQMAEEGTSVHGIREIVLPHILVETILLDELADPDLHLTQGMLDTIASLKKYLTESENCLATDRTWDSYMNYIHFRKAIPNLIAAPK